MQQEYTKLLSEILNGMGNTDHIQLGDIPDIDLYMDQVTHFMEEHLKNSKRYENDKILTKTMINNYAKNDLLPPPVKKKYSREHMLALIFIYYFKNILSITDLQALLKPLEDKFFHAESGMSLTDIYNEVFSMEKEQAELLKNDIAESFRAAQSTFADAPPEERERLQIFSFICLLSFDVYMKKQIIERMIDQLND